MNYCPYCGKEINNEQDICLSCGRFLPSNMPYKNKAKSKNYNTYSIVTGIITIVLGAIFIANAGLIGSDTNFELVGNYTSFELVGDYTETFYMFLVMGILSLTSGILSVCSKKLKELLIISGILLFLGALIDTILIKDISIFAIYAITIGILNIIFSQKKQQ